MPRYTVSILSSLVEPLLMPALDSAGLTPLDRREHYGFSAVVIECDAETAAKLGERFYVTPNE